MKSIIILLFVILFGIMASGAACAYAKNKKILYVASYHVDKEEWTSGIKSGIDSVLDSRQDLELKTVNMDTRLSKSEDIKKAAALGVKNLITSWKPDVVIVSDDNASKYLIARYYKDVELPFVFCGLNWDASVYGFPFKNVTGMVEVQLIKQIVSHLSFYAKGKRIGALRGNTLTNHKEKKHFEKHLNKKIDTRFVENYTDWKKQFLLFQNKVDMLLLGSLGALELEGVSMGSIENFIMANIKVPTAAYDAFMKDISLITLATIPEEQGKWAAEKALEILDGKSPQNIPIVQNKKGKLYLNMKIAKKLGIKFPIELIERSHLVSAKLKKLLLVNSYHKGYKWSDDIEKGLLKALNIKVNPDGSFDTSQSHVEFKVFRMKTKLNTSEEFKKKAALSAKTIIDEWHPDIVVTSDDNAAKYLIVPYYKNSEIPFVFCGLNWDASTYGFPLSNVTGMVEVAPVRETIKLMKKYARGGRIGFLGSKNISNRKEVMYHENLLKINYSDGKLVAGFDEWKKEYSRLQDAVDMIVLLNPVGITGWDGNKAEEFIFENTKIPTGSIGDSTARYTLLGRVKIAAEQGWWAGKTAIAVLDGKSIVDIPVARNKKSLLLVNMRLAKLLGIKFPMELLEKALLIEGSLKPGEH